MKKFLSLIIFSLPITSILVCKIIFKQILAHIPINFPPNITKYFGNINEGKNIIDIKIIPEKKNVLNKISNDKIKLTNKIKQLEIKNSLLTDNLDLDYIEILIRQKFLFGKEGEKIYLIKKNEN